MGNLAISLLGTFCITQDEHPVNHFESNKVRALLAYLAVESNRPHTREALSGLLWPDDPQQAAFNSLRNALANLRHVIGDRDASPGFLIITRGTIQINPASNVWLDVDHFEKTATQSREMDIQELIEGFAIYRDPFLKGFSVPDSEPFEEWASLQRERLGQQALQILRRITGWYESCGDYLSALSYAQRLVALEPWLEDGRRQVMRLMALCEQRGEALAQFQKYKQILASELGIEPGEETVQLYEAIKSGRLEVIHSGEPLPVPGPPPYKGLQHFDENDADLFFGRETLIKHLQKRVRNMADLEPDAPQVAGAEEALPVSLFAIVGASGSGKSSLVRAGLAPALQRDGFTVKVITPTSRPEEAVRDLWITTDLAACPKASFVLIIDQFEELFTQCSTEDERLFFLDHLLHPPSVVTRWVLILVLRADFYGHCAQYPHLRQALSANQEYIGSMTETELRMAIEEPAKRNGWKFDSGLVDLILQDLSAQTNRFPEPGALPLLEHTLLETWKRRRGRTLTLKGYSEAGGVCSAIAKTAEDLYENIDQNRQAIARQVFLRLVELGEGIHVFHRKSCLADLVPAGENRKTTLDVINWLANARLLVLEWNSASNQEEVELAHEALILHWPRLRNWLEEARGDIYLQERVRAAAQEWQAGGRALSLLMHNGSRLEVALQGHKDGRLVLNQVEFDYLMACRKQREAERLARERQRNWVILAALVITIVMALVALWGLLQANTARRNADISLGQQLSAQASEMLNRPLFGETAVLLAIESMRYYPNPAGSEILANSLALLPKTIAQITPGGRVSMVAFRPDGKWLAASNLDGSLSVWETETGREISRMQHAGQVGCVSFSPDGEHIITGSQDGTARVWNAQTGQEILRLTHAGPVWSIAYSPNGQWIASGSQDGTARVWNAQTGTELARVQHGGNVYAVAFSPNGDEMISGGQDGIARVWSAKTGKERLQVVNGSEIWVVTFGPNGKLAGTGGWDGVARVWNMVTGGEVSHMRHSLDVRSMAFNPDGTRVISGSYDGTVRVWEIENGREVTRMVHPGRVLHAGFNPDGTQAVSSSEDGTIRLWDANNGSEITHIHHTQPVPTVAFSMDGQMLASGGWDGIIKVWQPQSGREVARMQHAGGVAFVAFSPDASFLLSTSDDGTARIWETATSQEKARMLHGGRVSSAAFSPDGKMVASGSEDRTTRVWSTETGREVARMAHEDMVSSVAFSPNGTLVASASLDGSISVWEISSGRVVLKTLHPGRVLAIAFTPDGKQVVTSSKDGSINLWTLESEITEKPNMQIFDLSSVAFRQDGKLMITGREDGSIDIWNLKSGVVIHHMSHQSPVTSINFSADGKWAVSGSQDGTLRIWDIDRGTEMARFQHIGSIRSVAFRPDGREVVTGSQDGSIRVWLWWNDDLIQRACNRLSRNLSKEEWNQYIGEHSYRQTCPNIPANVKLPDQ